MSTNIWGEDVLDSKEYSDEDSVLYKGDLLESYDQESNNEFILNRKKFKQSLLSVETKIRLIEFPNSGSGQDIQPIQTVNPYWIQKNNFTIIASLDTSSSNSVRQFTLNPQDFKMDCNGYSSAILVAAIEDTLGAELFNKYIE